MNIVECGMHLETAAVVCDTAGDTIMTLSGVIHQGKRYTMKYVCTLCGYIYDPAENENIAFEDLPEDWECPLCGAGKDMFKPL